MRTARHDPPTDLIKTEDYSLRAETEQEQAFVRRYERLCERLCEWAAHYVGADEARDAVQRALLRIYGRWDELWMNNPPDSFFFGAVRREVLFMERSAAREALRLGGFLRYVRLPLHKAERPDRRLDATELNAVVKSAVASLPDECREVWTLVREHELSYDETAAALDLPPSTVRWHMMRARRLLQAALIAAGYGKATTIAPPAVPKLLPAPTAEEQGHE